jgi:hypothetical protein
LSKEKIAGFADVLLGGFLCTAETAVPQASIESKDL